MFKAGNTALDSCAFIGQVGTTGASPSRINDEVMSGRSCSARSTGSQFGGHRSNNRVASSLAFGG